MYSFKSCVSVLIIVSFMSQFVACSAPKNLSKKTANSISSGNYSEVLQNLNLKNFSDFHGSIFTLDNLCTANLKLGKFREFFACVDAYESQLTSLPLQKALEQYSGTFYYYKNPENSKEKALEVELKARVHRLKAEAYFMLGDYDEVLSQVETALKICRPDEEFWWCPQDAYGTDCIGSFYTSRIKNKYSPWHDDLFTVVSFGAMAQALKGEKQQAQKYVDLLKTLHVNPYDGKDLHGSMARIRQTHLNNVNFALGNYAEVKIAHQNQSEKNKELLGKGMQAGYWASGALIGLAAVAMGPVGLVPALLAGSYLGKTGFDMEEEAQFQMTAEMTLRESFQNAKVSEKTGAPSEAFEIYQQMVNSEPLGTMPDLHWMTLYEYARLLVERGERILAIEQLKKAADVIEKQRGNINSEAHKIGFAGSKENVYGLLVEQLFAEKKVDQAFEYVERAKARALVDMLAASSERPELHVATLNSPELTSLNRGRVNVSVDNDGKAAVRSITLDKKKLTVEQPKLASLVTVDIDSSNELVSELATNETLLEYYQSGEVLYAFVVNRQHIKGFPLRSAELANEIKTFRSAIQDPENQSYMAPARTLYRRLIEPLAASITTQQLTIVPHGALHYLPFAALHDGRDFLIDRYSLRMLPSASTLKYLPNAKTGKGTFLAFGNPTGDLPGAEQEVRALGRQVQSAHTLLNSNATETAFKEHAGGYDILHIASHGEFNVEQPLASRLLLAPDTQNDGNLTVAELYDQKIDAELVILSACETGLGEIENGDDVIGLNRGFLFAGAESIVSSLWTVDDEATKQLMLSFYDNLRDYSRADALRKSQVYVKERFNDHPFYWAAFQLTGKLNNKG